MKPDMQPEEQEFELPGQMAFFPEMEPEDPAPYILLQKPISPPELSQMEQWKLSVLLSDVLQRFDGRLPERWLYEIMVGGGFLSYFVYADALGALTDHGAAVLMPDESGEQCCVLTETGRRNVKNLRLMVPKLFRDQVHLCALRYVTRQRALRDLQISYETDAKGCRLCLRCTDHGAEMFFLRISAPSKENAEELGERILRNPARFFGKILDLAMTNEEEPFDLTDN
ncbi:MAG: DUF4364 family protein [Oscillospiraceae bacterium]|nr:DUF4364 family protein [Oscillospiraceae bacterium]MCR4759469.1 DUF4364 family protein [Oscillospiraceae bacterium]